MPSNQNVNKTTIKHVGFIGMGIMGLPMATNILSSGFAVTCYNRTAAKCVGLAGLGAAVASTPRELAEIRPQVICINVTDTPDVEQVLFGDNGIAKVDKNILEGLIIIDFSTINPASTQQFAQQLHKLGVTLLDAPVSGGDIGAQNGTLSIMVGGKEQAFNTCLPVFEAVGKNITHLGPSGMGQTCKACNQIAVSCNLIGVCEALALAKQSGLDLEKMISVVTGGAAGSWQLANLGPKIAAGEYNPGFMIDLVLKDLAIVADAGRAMDLPLNATALAEGYFRSAKSAGQGQQGTQAMAKTLEKLGGFTFND